MSDDQSTELGIHTEASKRPEPRTLEAIEAKRLRLHQIRQESAEKQRHRELLTQLDVDPAEMAWRAFDQIGAVYQETDQDLPTEFNFARTAGMSDADAFLLTVAFDGYISYLKRPVIKDHFKVHKDRAIWRKQVEADLHFMDQNDGKNKRARVDAFTEIYKSNRLNLNSLFEIPGYTELLLDDPDKLPRGFPIASLEKIRELSKLFKTNATSSEEYIKNPSPWDSLPLENTKDENGQVRLGKIAIITQLEHELLTIVNFLGKR